jgi:hypothetical protein
MCSCAAAHTQARKREREGSSGESKRAAENYGHVRSILRCNWIFPYPPLLPPILQMLINLRRMRREKVSFYFWRDASESAGEINSFGEITEMRVEGSLDPRRPQHLAR